MASRPGQGANNPKEVRQAEEGSVRDDCGLFIAMEDSCGLSHVYSLHLTYADANGNVDKAASSKPLAPADTAAHPPIGFRAHHHRPDQRQHAENE